jgi:uncharacterized membrane protein
MMYWGGHMGAGDWLGSVLITLLVVALIVWVVRMVVSASSTGQRHTPSEAAQPPEPSARELLDRRLANGEITTEQYHQMRDALDDGGRQAAQPGRS